MNSLTEIGVLPEMNKLFKNLGYTKIDDEIRSMISSLLLERISYIKYNDSYLRDALIALISLTIINKKTL